MFFLVFMSRIKTVKVIFLVCTRPCDLDEKVPMYGTVQSICYYVDVDVDVLRIPTSDVPTS